VKGAVADPATMANGQRVQAVSRAAASSLRAAAAAPAGSAMHLLPAMVRHGSASSAPGALRMAASAPSNRVSRARMVPGGLNAARGPDAQNARQNVPARASARAGHAATRMTARRAVSAAMGHLHALMPARIVDKVMTARSAGMAMHRAVLPGPSAGPSCRVVATLNGWPRPRRLVVSSASPR
jgi:hypothetical protein